MKLRNFWLMKSKEKLLLKIVEWAQKNNKRVQRLTNIEIKHILKEDIEN
jgi:hypothetical protein